MKTDIQNSVNQADRVAFREDLEQKALRAYRRLSLGIAAFAGLFLLVLFYYQLFADLDPHHLSISHYYYENLMIVPPEALGSLGLGGFRLGDIFVGILTAIAVFLILFSGFSNLEDNILNFAGLMLLGVAFFPTYEYQTSTEFSVSLHLICALAFFAAIALVATWFSPHRARFVKWPGSVGLFKKSFIATGLSMIFLPACVVGIHFADWKQVGDWIFWFEWLAILAFCVFWSLKFVEFGKILTKAQLG